MIKTNLKIKISRILFFFSGIGMGISIGKIVSLVKGYCPLNTSGVLIMMLLSIISFLFGIWFIIDDINDDKRILREE